MKVLQVGSSLFDWGGIERYVAYLSEGLTARGHQVTVIAPPQSPLAKRASGEIVPIALRGKYRVGLIPTFLRRMRELRPDVVHIHFSPDFLIPAWCARRAGVRRVIMTRHVSLPWRAAQVRRVMRLFDGFIAVSGSVERRLVESGIPSDRVVVAKAGTPALVPTVPRDQVRADFGIGPEKVAAGFFGRLVPEKGIRELVMASSEAPSVALNVFGDGPERAMVESAASPQLAFRGFVPDVANAMAAMDFIVIPSVWEEAFPYSALEAMSLGQPILASRIGGLPELVEDGVTGRLVAAGSAGELAAGLEAMARDTSGRKQMGAEAMQRHRDLYTVASMAERIESAYLRFGVPA